MRVERSCLLLGAFETVPDGMYLIETRAGSRKGQHVQQKREQEGKQVVKYLVAGEGGNTLSPTESCSYSVYR